MKQAVICGKGEPKDSKDQVYVRKCQHKSRRPKKMAWYPWSERRGAIVQPAPESFTASTGASSLRPGALWGTRKADSLVSAWRKGGSD